MIRSAIVVLFVILSQAAVAEAPEGYPFQPFDKAMQLARSENKPLFVYFGRYGCGYCEKTNKEAFSDSGVRKAYTQHYILAYVDAESGKRMQLPSGERITERDLGSRYNAFVTPVFSFLTPDGRQILQLVGVQRIVDLVNADKKVQQSLQNKNKS